MATTKIDVNNTEDLGLNKSNQDNPLTFDSLVKRYKCYIESLYELEAESCYDIIMSYFHLKNVGLKQFVRERNAEKFDNSKLTAQTVRDMQLSPKPLIYDFKEIKYNY